MFRAFHVWSWLAAMVLDHAGTLRIAFRVSDLLPSCCCQEPDAAEGAQCQDE